MCKKLIFVFSIFLIYYTSVTTFGADEPQLELAVKKVDRVSDEEVIIQYGVINRRDFDCFNVSVAFKIMDGEVPVGCKEVKETIPKGADGTDIKEVKIKVPAKSKAQYFSALSVTALKTGFQAARILNNGLRSAV